MPLHAEAGRSAGARAKRHGGVDRGIGLQLNLSGASYVPERPDEAHCVHCGDELLGVSAIAVAAHLFRRVELDVELAIIGLCNAVATAGSGGVGGIDNLLKSQAFFFGNQCSQ
jgi:hypothetical protein